MKYHYANGYNFEKCKEKIEKYVHGRSDISGQCVYFHVNGRRCAIGAFLPSTAIKIKKLEGNNVLAILKDHPQLREYMPILEGKGLDKFQEAHDFVGKDATELEVQSHLLNWLDQNVEEAMVGNESNP